MRIQYVLLVGKKVMVQETVQLLHQARTLRDSPSRDRIKRFLEEYVTGKLCMRTHARLVDLVA